MTDGVLLRETLFEPDLDRYCVRASTAQIWLLVSLMEDPMQALGRASIQHLSVVSCP